MSDEEARLLEERLNAAERAASPVVAVESPIEPSTSPVEPAPTTVPTGTRKVSAAKQEAPREARISANYPRGKGSKADPYRRAKDGKSLRSTTVFLADDVHEQLRMYCARHERSQSDVIAEALELHLRNAR
ncbi:hypothetical protein [Sandaracinus amylolyticus]|uniref:hypothetical protein n=1 Tax=Sandaracinus amylolyticus TaxID=927083 RepID=UPI001F3F1599|nr:hypothetical protein [Sandaracinus amylolyticus]